MGKIQLNDNDDELSLIELIQSFKEWIRFLKTKSLKILISLLLGGIGGFLFAFFYPTSYTAKTSFVVEESKSGTNFSGLASLAGQFGVDLGSNSGGNLIAGENILFYFKSENLIRKTLLKPWNQNLTFADQYIKVNGLKDKINKRKDLQGLLFVLKDGHYIGSRKEDSVLHTLVKKIIKSELEIYKLDKKAGFIELSITMQDEEFAKRFSEELLNTAIDGYLSLKTKRQKETVVKLQKRADSISALLNQKAQTSAMLQTSVATMDVNPIFQTPTAIKNELTLRDKGMLGSIYVEVVKNLEMAKFTLSQETPVIQVVNTPIYPLQLNKRSFFSTIVLFSLVSLFFQSVFLIINRWYKNNIL